MPRGSLLVNGKPVSDKQLASLAGVAPKDASGLIAELEDSGVFSRDPDGTIFSRRMRRDDERAARDKANGGKADALNCGINMARYPLVCCMDGDSLLENDALLRIARPFMDRPDMVASGGVIRPLNGCRVTPMGIRGIHLPEAWLARFQVVEYLRAFLFTRVGLASLDSVFIVSGAFGVFRKDVVVQAGGFERGTVGEDFELVLRLHHRLRAWGRPYHITLVPDPICWTEVPEDLKTLSRQQHDLRALRVRA